MEPGEGRREGFGVTRRQGGGKRTRVRERKESSEYDLIVWDPKKGNNTQ